MTAPIRDWLGIQCRMIAGVEAGILVLGSSPQAPGAEVARWPEDRETGARLLASLAEAQERGRLVVQNSETEAPGPATHVALPLLGVDGNARPGGGALAVSVRGVPAAEVKALVGLLGFAARGLSLLLQTADEAEPLRRRLLLAGELLDHERVDEAAHAVAVDLARRLGCERVAVGHLEHGRLRVVALSSSPRFDRSADTTRALGEAMDEAIALDALVTWPAEGDAAMAPAHASLAQGDGLGAVCSLPLAWRGRCVGAITCTWRDAHGGRPEATERLRDSALLCGPLLELLTQAEAGPIDRLRRQLAARVEHHFGTDRSSARGTALAAALIVGLLAVVPAPYQIPARATLEGRVQRALVAGVPGYLAETNARAGDLVQGGEVLARLDDRDLALEMRKQESRRAQLDKEYREALTEGDRTQVSILRARIEQAEAQLALVREQLGRTRVVAPFDGVVLEGDLDHSLGSPVELGSVLFELAPLDGYRIILQVDGRDIADVAPGQGGRLALEALPDRPLPLVVERITPIATSEDGRSYFRVEARLEEPADSLRPGMEGIARIDAGRRRLLWIWTHETLDWLRLRAWSLMP